MTMESAVLEKRTASIESHREFTNESTDNLKLDAKGLPLIPQPTSDPEDVRVSILHQICC